MSQPSRSSGEIQFKPVLSFGASLLTQTCREEGDGWCLFGHAKTFVGFKDVEGTISDNEGKKWSAVMEAAFHFWYVKDESGPDGIKIKETRIYADPMPAVGFMLQHGIVSAKDLGFA
jgi:hypothetical protein